MWYIPTKHGRSIESIEATVDIIDMEMGKDPWYLTVGKTPFERVVKLLSKFDSIMVSKDRGSMVSKESEMLFNKFIKQVEPIVNNLPKSLKWQSFFIRGLILLTDIPLKVQKASVKLGLNLCPKPLSRTPHFQVQKKQMWL